MKCTKVKNPCKICLQSVCKKNGIQCQGACQKWAHYKCLNYTPGKIQDIKGGYIKVTCPCPDCSTSESKEVLANPPYTCTNTQCPSNKLPICASKECPSNRPSLNNIPTYPPPPFEYSPTSSPQAGSPNCPKKCPMQLTSSSKLTPKRKQSPKRPFASKPIPLSKCSSSQIYVKPKGNRMPCPPMCPSHQVIKISNKKPCSPKQSKSFSNISNSSCTGEPQCGNMRTISSDTQMRNISTDQKVLHKAIENLCKTMGQLSNQLNDLLGKMNRTGVK